MLSFHSRAWAALTLGGGIMAIVSLPNSVSAGDKIEFSSPNGTLDVPRVEIEDKDSSKPEDQGGPPLNRMVGGEYSTPMEYIVVTPAKKHSDRIWGSPDRDNNDEADNPDENPDSRNDNSSRARSLDKNNPDPGTSFNHFPDARNNRESVDPDSLRGRLEAIDAAEKADLDQDGRYGRNTARTREDSLWAGDNANRAVPRDSARQKLSAFSQSLFHQPAVGGINRMEDKSSYNVMKSINEQAYSAMRANNAQDDIQRNLTPSPAPDNSFGPATDDSLRRAQDDAMSPGLSLHDQESLSATLSPERAARAEVPPSQRWHVEEQPAILQFPKKPGDVLH